MSAKRTVLKSLPIPALPGWEFRVVKLEYPPGLSAPPHTHPVAAIGYVVRGEVISQWEGKEVERYTTGETFVDLGEELHVRAENASHEEPLVMLVSYVIKVGEPNVQLK